MKLEELIPEWKELNDDLGKAKDCLRRNEGKEAMMFLASCAITCVQFAVRNEIEKAIKHAKVSA